MGRAGMASLILLAAVLYGQDSLALRTVNQYDTPGYAQGLAFQGDLLFVTDRSGGPPIGWDTTV